MSRCRWSCLIHRQKTCHGIKKSTLVNEMPSNQSIDCHLATTMPLEAVVPWWWMIDVQNLQGINGSELDFGGLDGTCWCSCPWNPDPENSKNENEDGTSKTIDKYLNLLLNLFYGMSHYRIRLMSHKKTSPAREERPSREGRDHRISFSTPCVSCRVVLWESFTHYIFTVLHMALEGV